MPSQLEPRRTERSDPLGVPNVKTFRPTEGMLRTERFCEPGGVGGGRGRTVQLHETRGSTVAVMALKGERLIGTRAV